MAFHGLRQSYAAEWYLNLVQGGNTSYEARRAVAKLLGHGRDDVIRIYLASLKGDGHLKHDLIYPHLKRIFAQMGIPNLRFHDLRHPYAVLSIQAGGRHRQDEAGQRGADGPLYP